MSRDSLLQQIPVFALRQLLISRAVDDENNVRQRLITTLKAKPVHLKKRIFRLTREEITKVIQGWDQITIEQIMDLFEDYRYGQNPSFYIYLFRADKLNFNVSNDLERDSFSQGITKSIDIFNQAQESDADLVPKIRKVAINDLQLLDNNRGVVEGHYRFQSQMNYIDEDQNAVTVYQTLYGFFWLNSAKGYVIIQGTEAKVLAAIKEGIEVSGGIRLVRLVISKSFKNSLPFLSRNTLNFSKLSDPNPDSENFRFISIKDDQLYKKKYEDYEQRYPEVVNAKYRDEIEDDKYITLSFSFTKGSVSLSGKLRASQFRDWCLNRLDAVIDTLQHLESTREPVHILSNRDLKGIMSY